MPELVYVRDGFVRHAWWLACTSALLAALVLGVFGWDLSSVLIWTLVGSVIWGVFKFFEDVTLQLPRGKLLAPPDGARIRESESPFAVRFRSVVFVVGLCAGAAYLGDRWDIGAVLVPGQFVGYTCAYVAGAWAISRWERGHRRRVLIEIGAEDEKAALYATRR